MSRASFQPRGLGPVILDSGHHDVGQSRRHLAISDARILRRLEAGLDPEENHLTDPFVFFQGDRVLYRQALARNPEARTIERPEVRQGRGFLRDGKLVEEPFDFTHSNYLSVRTLQGVLRSVLFPEAVPPAERFRLSEDDDRFLYAYMSPTRSSTPTSTTERAVPPRRQRSRISIRRERGPGRIRPRGA